MLRVRAVRRAGPELPTRFSGCLVPLALPFSGDIGVDSFVRYGL